MPVVTKYKLYRPDITNDDYPPNPLFPNWYRLSHRFVPIDTRAILHQAIEGGKLGAFYIDDSHCPQGIGTCCRCLGRNIWRKSVNITTP